MSIPAPVLFYPARTAPQPPPPQPAFNNAPPPAEVFLQHDDWSCAVRSGYWMAWSMNHDITYQDFYNRMVPIYDDASVGLHEASGVGMANVLRQLGYDAHSRYPVTLADVGTLAGTRAVAIGCGKWGAAGHWVGVRDKVADGTLQIVNPAPHYAGINDQLSQADFDRIGPIAMVWIEPNAGATLPPTGSNSQLAPQYAQWMPSVTLAAAKYNLKPSLILGVISVETGGQNIIGDAGHGHGLMQVDDRSHGNWLNSHSDGLDPASNIDYGSSILRWSIDYFNGEIRSGVAAYNAGAGGATNGLRDSGNPDQYTTGGNYSAKVLARAAEFQNQGVT
jgi:hypothetical protein